MSPTKSAMPISLTVNASDCAKRSYGSGTVFAQTSAMITPRGSREEPVHPVVNGVGRMVTVMPPHVDVVRGGRVVPHLEFLASLVGDG